MFLGLFGSDDDTVIEAEHDTPYNYEDCVQASTEYRDAVDTATDTFAGWVKDDHTGWEDVVDTSIDAYVAYDHKEEICNFGE